LLVAAILQSITLLHEIGAQRMTVLKLAIQGGAGVFGEIFGRLSPRYSDFSGFEASHPALAFLGQSGLSDLQCGPLISKPLIENPLSVIHCKAPYLDHGLSYRVRDFWKRAQLPQSASKLTSPRIEHACDGVGRTGAELGPNLFDGWIFTGAQDGAGRLVDLVLSDASCHDMVSSIGALLAWFCTGDK